MNFIYTIMGINMVNNTMPTQGVLSNNDRYAMFSCYCKVPDMNSCRDIGNAAFRDCICHDF